MKRKPKSIAYWFAPWSAPGTNPQLGNGDCRPVVVGKTHEVKGPPKLCNVGLHFSRRIIDALGYAQSLDLYEVEPGGEILEPKGEDKGCATKRTYLRKLDFAGVMDQWLEWCVKRAEANAAFACSVARAASAASVAWAARAASAASAASVAREASVASAASVAWAARAAREAREASVASAASALSAASAASVASAYSAASAARAAREAELDAQEAELRRLLGIKPTTRPHPPKDTP